ncbi:PREDICTED: protein LKAAEAR1 [Nanorana parkeri]|uniref:protein LKAAEAR1 n=1 Tax=Nanorana parkeri TaxID=125878 RepID=UPI000854AF69|nr:PREDICTED: protein LKAAEAR1 [Nanorana parkeri]
MASDKDQLKSKPLKKGASQGKMDPMQRARHLAYVQPSKSVAASIAVTQNRLKEHALRSQSETQKRIPDLDQERQAKVVGQLKAAEARNRIRLMRFRFQYMRAQELNNLISLQPTALDAIRLEVFLPPRARAVDTCDTLQRFQREHIENLLKDERGLLTNRIP